MQQHFRARGFRGMPLGPDRRARLVAGEEILAVELEAYAFLAREDRVGLGACGNEDRPCLQLRSVREFDRGSMAMRIDLDALGRQVLEENDAFFERLRDFLVVQRVRRAVDHAAAVGDGRAAPGLEERELLRRGRIPENPRVREEFFRDLLLLAAPVRLDLQGLVARQELLDLDRVVGERLGRRIDRGEAAADHDDRQADLQVGDGFALGRSRELQRHEKVGGRAHAAREAVRDLEHRRAPGAGAQRDVVEALAKRLVDRQGAAEAHPAEHRELRSPLEQQPYHLEEVLVPAHRDAVLGDAAETRHHPAAEGLAQVVDVLDGSELGPVPQRVHARDLRIQGLDLQAVDADHRVAVVHQVVSGRKAGGAETHHENSFSRGRPGIGAPQVEGVPAREQRIDLEAVGELKDVL